ncbi:alpha/beta hydrolase [Cohnella pontilimi]|uniref:Alpha/beta hydrolase n=1 Tax=Cohnella pontilimi TaxID=2564100 RepID=A0A4U0FDP0_9BACL|nr:alpha/beta hydrolase [Cohnella pontilimi]TJY42901.1 alpha/beta hydrolase [Cohnella pontilimi]
MLKTLALGIGISAIGLVAGIFASLAASAYTLNPAWFLSAGLLAYGVVCFFGFWLAFRRSKKQEMWRPAAVLSGIVLLLAAYVLLKPLEALPAESVPIEGVRYWELSTGSRIAYVHAAGIGGKQPYPVVFVHGGPGTPDMAGDLRYFGELAEWGYDVYIYDQLGSGKSSRLQDPGGYSLQRDAADLEAIRQQIGAERMILIGHSYGCEIIAHYLVSHENRVAKAVLTSPGAINPSDHSDANLTARLNGHQRIRLYRELLHPRVLFAYALLQMNPAAAHSFAGDKEMDARFDRVYAETEPALHAGGKRYPYRISGLGFYAHQTPQSHTAPEKPDLRKALETVQVPVLIFKGSEDYLSRESAIDYKKALRNSRLIDLQAGHNVYQDQPDTVMESIRLFL